MLSKVLPGLVCLASLGQAVRAQDTPIADDSFFYGQSEPVFPTPEMMETGPWADAVTKAKGLVSQLSLEEKVNLTGGVTSATGCSGFIAPIPRVGFPGMCLADAGQGVRQTDYVSAWPAAMHVGASFNKELARKRAHFIGGEAKAKGVNSLLGPCIGPLGRHPIGGRNWESFSNDPYLDGKIVFETVSGIQAEGVIATTKEQETHRLPTTSEPMVEAVSSNIDDKTMHEAYMWPFYDAVKAGTGSIMCSYNRLNNSKAQNGLLKGELGFQGWVVSDWGAQRTGVASALGGLDVAMPSGLTHWGGNLTLAVNNGTVDEATVNNMATRVLASWFQMKQDTNHPEPGVGMPKDLSKPHKIIDARNASAKSTLFEGAVEGHVLVKNTDGALPLDGAKMKLVSLFGYSAKAPDANNYAKAAPGARFAAWAMGAASGNLEELNIGFMGNLSYGPYSSTSRNGTLISGGGSGATAQNLISAPYDALVAQAHEDGTALFWDFESGAPLVNPMSDACLVIGNAWATEGYDRPELRDDFTDGLILNVADQCANTIVVLHNAGVRLVDQFIDHPNVTAVIFAHLPGQESGRALISLLYGRSNPSGRLPYTVARNESDYGSVVKADDFPAREKYARFPQADFKEGVFIDYKDFDVRNVTPRYEFGFGLSYTTFAYADLQAATTDKARGELPVGPVAEGGQEDLWDVVATVTARVRNTGARDGHEVAQLYVGLPGAGQPARQLRGFEKPRVAAGAEAEVEFPLTRRDLSTWDVAAQKWRLQRGDYQIYVGSSSRNLPLKTTLTLKE